MCKNEKHTHYDYALKLRNMKETSSLQPKDQPKKQTRRNKIKDKKGKEIYTKVECICRPCLLRHSSNDFFRNISAINPSNFC